MHSNKLGSLNFSVSIAYQIQAVKVVFDRKLYLTKLVADYYLFLHLIWAIIGGRAIFLSLLL